MADRARITAVRKIDFCCAHRLLGHPEQCANLHGHNYSVLVHVQSAELDNIGCVTDFSIIKQRVGGWIDSNWDHALLYSSTDEQLEQVAQSLHPGKSFQMPGNPTAENMAIYLLNVVCPGQLQDLGVTAVKVVVHETANCFAEVVV